MVEKVELGKTSVFSSERSVTKKKREGASMLLRIPEKIVD